MRGLEIARLIHEFEALAMLATDIEVHCHHVQTTSVQTAFLVVVISLKAAIQEWENPSCEEGYTGSRHSGCLPRECCGLCAENLRATPGSVQCICQIS